MNESILDALLFPGASASHEFVADADASHAPPNFSMRSKKINILMVDDQPAKLLSYEAILSGLGENLIRATSGTEALRRLLEDDVAVVLIDVNMPELDGFQLADLIRKHPRFDQTALIFVSALHMTDSDRLKGYERGGVDYLSVPVVPEILRAKVKLFVELRRKSQELEEKNNALRHLSRRLMTAQDTERRRIARNLHDSLGQYLASVRMSLELMRPSVSPDAATHLSSAEESVEKCITETRTISQLLHPPLLDEAGLISATRLYVEGFSRRSGIEAKLNLPAGVRFPELTELNLFRILQESLTNVHRHSGSSSVEIEMKIIDEQVMLVIRDFGHGMSGGMTEGFQASGIESGVGLAGMRERVADLGGRLDIQSDEHGTTVVARVPLTAPTKTHAERPDRTVETSAA